MPPHEVDALVRRMVERNPPNPADFTTGIAVGCFMDEPPPGTIAGRCENCGMPILIGPDTQKALVRMPLTRRACIICVLALFIVTGEEPTTFRACDLLNLLKRL